MAIIIIVDDEEELREKCPDIPIGLVTASSQPDTREEAMKNGANLIILKPYSPTVRCTPLSRQQTRKFKVGLQPRFCLIQVSVFLGVRSIYSTDHQVSQ